MSNYSFKVESIFAVESSFKRSDVIDFEQYSNAENIMDITITQHYSEKQDSLIVSLGIEVKQKIGSDIVVEGKVIYLGDFTIEGEAPPHIMESFSKINAPAIIFPYVREFFTNASARAGIPPIFIQPINFIERAKIASDDKDTK